MVSLENYSYSMFEVCDLGQLMGVPQMQPVQLLVVSDQTMANLEPSHVRGLVVEPFQIECR